MKRVIKYYNIFNCDGVKFSNSSTKYEAYPILVEDDANGKDLNRIAKELGLIKNPKRKIFTSDSTYRKDLDVTHAIKIEMLERSNCVNRKEKYQVYLGFITLPNDSDPLLPPKETLKNKIDKDTAWEIVNRQDYGVSDVGSLVDGGTIVVKSNWNYDNEMELLGYDLESFQEVLGITEEGFDDDTYQCSNCGKFDHKDNGYVNNHLIVNDELLGVNCGCVEEAQIEGYKDFIIEEAPEDDGDIISINRDAANKLEEKKKIEKIDSYCSRWGDTTGTPSQVITEYLKENKGAKVIVSFDNGAQFESRWSLWKVAPEILSLKFVSELD